MNEWMNDCVIRYAFEQIQNKNRADRIGRIVFNSKIIHALNRLYFKSITD